MIGPRRPSRRRGPERFGTPVLTRLAALALLGLMALTLGLGVAGLIVLSRPAPSAEAPAGVVAGAPAPVKPAPRPSREVSFAEGCVTAECHGPMLERPHLHLTFAEEACDYCHAPDVGGHVYPQLASTQNTCTSCHDTGAHHTFQHKAMSEEACLACHDPHGSDSPNLLLASTVAQTCERCHPRDSRPITHPPYQSGRCVDCHDPHGADNATLLLGGEPPENCRLCHGPTVVAMEHRSHTHGGVEGSCLACHDGHAAGAAGLLAAQPRELCVSCHEDVGGQVEGALVSHDAVLTGEQCATCHDPHASDHPSMLRGDQQQVCLGCHAEPVRAPDGREVAAIGPELAGAAMVHGAVSIGECSACHAMHGATYTSLLREVNPSVLTGSFDLRNYALCFACHDKRLAELPNATRFRDGAENLHAVHLRAGDKSGGCSDCHAVHAGSQARLVVANIRYQGSRWESPMNFVLTPTGGSCAPGCHEALPYDNRLPTGDGGTP